MTRLRRIAQKVLDRSNPRNKKNFSGDLLRAVEDENFRVLGKEAALMVHDLCAPLHVMRFCLDELRKDDLAPSTQDQYLEKLRSNLEHAMELVGAFKARFKNPARGVSHCSFREAHSYVIRYLKIQFAGMGFDRIRFHLDPPLMEVSLRIPGTHLIQILDNLYRNSVENLLIGAIRDPEIRIHLLSSTATAPLGSTNVTQISITDNGSGLSKRDFEKITRSPQNSSGLKLTLNLIEHHQGSLTLLSQSGKAGTSLCLSLRGARKNTRVATIPTPSGGPP